MTPTDREALEQRLVDAERDLTRATAGSPLCSVGGSPGTKYEEGRVAALREALRGSQSTDLVLRRWLGEAEGGLAASPEWRSYLAGGIHELKGVTTASPAAPHLTEG